jgi:hypothetical protein
MGVAIDTEAMFGMDLTTAFDQVRASQEPIASAHSLPPTTSITTMRERETSGGGGGGGGGGGLQSSGEGGAGGGADVLKFQRGHVMERRHIAEHLGDPQHTPPNTAMSLGGCVMSCCVMACCVMSCHVCHVMLCHVMLCHVMLCHVMLCHVMLCHVMLCHVMLCHVMLCHVMSRVLCYTLYVLHHDLMQERSVCFV